MNDRAAPSKWRAAIAGAALVLGAGGIAVAVAATTGAPAGAPVLRQRPNHLIGLLRPNHLTAPLRSTKARTRNTASTNLPPCWGSSNWSGYAVSTVDVGLSCVLPTKTNYTTVTSTWTVPTVAATSRPTFSSAWTGIDGFSNSSLIQTGTEQDYYNGQAHYAAWWEILPAAETVIPQIAVHPGDSMTGTINLLGGGHWSITLADNTHSATFTTTDVQQNQLYTGPGTSAEFIVEAPSVNGSTATLAHYGRTNFTTGPTRIFFGSSGEMVQRSSFFRSSVVSIASDPNSARSAFNIAYGANAPSPPTP